MPNPGDTTASSSGFMDVFNEVVNAVNSASQAFNNVWSAVKGNSSTMPDYSSGSASSDAGAPPAQSNFFKQNQTLLIVMAAVLIVVGGAVFFLRRKKPK